MPSAGQTGSFGHSATRRQDWVWLAGIILGLLFSLFPLASYTAAVPIIRDEWGINGSQAGLLNSLFAAGAMAGALIIIPLTDRLSPGKVLAFSGLAAALGNLLFPLLATDVATGAPLRFLAGVGLVGVYVTGTRVVAERFSEHGRGAAIGLYVTAFYLGSAASLVVTGLLIPSFGWRVSYAVWAIVSFATPPIAYVLLRNHSWSATQDATARFDPSVLKNKTVGIVILSYFLHSFELYHLRTWLPAFLAFVLMTGGTIESADAAARAAIVVGAAGMLGAVSPFLGGVLSDRVGRLRAATFLFAVSGAVSFAIGWLADIPWAGMLALTFLYSFAVGADSAIYSTAITEVAETGKLGSTLAVHTFSAFAAGFLSPVIFGGILDVAGDDIGWGLGFGTAGIAAVAAIGAMTWLRRQGPAEPQLGETRGVARRTISQ